MNRHAVVLAADSATTVTQWNGASREVRYFKGANKIHALSNQAPVGLMVFAGAAILNVPWEVAIKAFKSHLGSKTYDSVEGYASAFFNFLESETRYFPLDVQRASVIDAAKRLAYKFSMEARDACGPGASTGDWTAKLDTQISDARTEVDAEPLTWGVDAAWASSTVLALTAEVASAVDTYLNLVDREPRPTDFNAFAELIVWTLIKYPDDHLGSTGLVVAGYGDDDIFPSHIQYRSAGLMMGKHFSKEEDREVIKYENPANLAAFAQKGMIDTFQLGMDMSIYIDAILCLDESIDQFASDLASDLGTDLTAAAKLSDIKDAARAHFSQKWLDRTRAKHANPLRRVLSALPIQEMADLAETLVNLQSLKEKVTKPSEEVGGPIDVAVITKAEGLVWIRRKHYFQPGLNARYMAKIARQNP